MRKLAWWWSFGSELSRSRENNLRAATGKQSLRRSRALFRDQSLISKFNCSKVKKLEEVKKIHIAAMANLERQSSKKSLHRERSEDSTRSKQRKIF